MTFTIDTPNDTAAHGPSTSSRGTRVLGILVLIGIGIVSVMGLVTSPPDVVQQDAVRIFYVHVPSVITMYFGVLTCSFASVMWLRKRTDGWDALAVAGAELGALFTGLGLVTGMLWGKITWGVFWTWDARLTSTALLFVLLLGYLALRRYPIEAAVRSRMSAVVGILLLPNSLIVNRSVEWWRSLHQDSTLVKLDPTIEGEHLQTFGMAMVVFVLLFTWLLIHRFRVSWLEIQAEHHTLDSALAERVADADASAGIAREESS